VNGRERVLAAFTHVEPDVVPIDVAATAASVLEPDACAALCAHLGLTVETRGENLDELLDVLEPDLGRVRLGAGGGVTLWDGLTLPARGETAATRDLERAAWPEVDDPARFRGLREQAARHRARGRAVVLDTELGLVDGCQRLRGTTGWLEDLLSASAFATALMERVTWVCAEIVRNALRVLGDAVDAVVLYEDLAGQTRTLMSPELYRTLIKPFQAVLVDAVHAESSARAVIHCDGAVSELLRDFVEIGVDAINPVQISARGMEPGRVKRLVGNKLSLWGGCDAAGALIFGSPADVEAEATRVLEALAPGGGYVFGPVHPIGATVPPENLLALVRAARAFRPVR
jgi:uroporphyrinogen decarboxylase